MNQAQIAKAKVGETLWDDKIRGLHLRVMATKRVFYLSFRTKAGKQRRPKIGDVAYMSLAQARERAAEMLREVAAGKDPAADIRALKSVPTVRQLAARYVWHMLRDPREKKRRKSCITDVRKLKQHVLPLIGKKLVTDVEREDVTAIHSRMVDTPYQANRVLSLLSHMFNMAERWKLRANHSNPCRHVRRYKEHKRKRIMTREEAPIIAGLLEKYEADHLHGVLFLYLLILTGARPDEIARATPELVVGDCIVLKEHKTDRYVDERIIYLPERVRVMLAKLPTKRKHLAGIKTPPAKLWQKIRKEAGCPDLRMYDLRRTFASVALSAGYGLDQIGKLFDHQNTATTSRYAWLMDDVRDKMGADVANTLERLMEGKGV